MFSRASYQVNQREKRRSGTKPLLRPVFPRQHILNLRRPEHLEKGVLVRLCQQIAGLPSPLLQSSRDLRKLRLLTPITHIAVGAIHELPPGISQQAVQRRWGVVLCSRKSILFFLFSKTKTKGYKKLFLIVPNGLQKRVRIHREASSEIKAVGAIHELPLPLLPLQFHRSPAPKPWLGGRGPCALFHQPRK